MCIKAIVFDMDGVLIDAKDWHYEALNQALGLFGFHISRKSHETRFDGLPTKVKLKTLSEESMLPVSLHPFINKMKQVYTLKLVQEYLVPDADQVAMMRRLRLEGYRIGVASNSIRQTVDEMMDRAGLTPFLDFRLSNEDVTLAKPSPEIYQLAMVKAGVLPHECLVVEDNAFGFEAARNAGAHLLEVASVEQANYKNIQDRIRSIIQSNQSSHAHRRAA